MQGHISIRVLLKRKTALTIQADHKITAVMRHSCKRVMLANVLYQKVSFIFKKISEIYQLLLSKKQPEIIAADSELRLS